jgi:hypothetical protein
VVGLVTLTFVNTAIAREEQSVSGSSASLPVLYRFTGVTDDGEQGSATRKEATTIHCTNVGSNIAQVEVQVYQWNGTDVYTGTANIPVNGTLTFSTQNTTIYFDDVILGGSLGTPAIFQGSGKILSSSPQVFCTAQALDPLTYPPNFVTKLPLFDRFGRLIKRTPPLADLLYLPILIR